MIWVVLAIIVGIVVGVFLPFNIPPAYTKYVSVSFLAGLDSVLGALRAGKKKKFNFVIFASGFVTNALLAALLTLMGDRMGVDLYIAAIVAFGVRIFNNLSFIRRDILLGLRPKKQPSAEKNPTPQKALSNQPVKERIETEEPGKEMSPAAGETV